MRPNLATISKKKKDRTKKESHSKNSARLRYPRPRASGHRSLVAILKTVRLTSIKNRPLLPTITGNLLLKRQALRKIVCSRLDLNAAISGQKKFCQSREAQRAVVTFSNVRRVRQCYCQKTCHKYRRCECFLSHL